MKFEFNKKSTIYGIILAIGFTIAPIIGTILSINDGNLYIIWGIIAIFNLIYFIGIFYYLTKVNFLQIEDGFKIIEEEKMLEKKSDVSREILLIFVEIIFWISLLIISFLFLYIHGFLIVSDGYYEQAQVYYYLLFGGDTPSATAFTIYYERKFFFRPLYPLLTAIFSYFFTFLFPGINTMALSGIFINITSGFLILYFFGKINSLLTNSQISNRMSRFLIGTLPTFIVYWTKFSTDMFFLLFFTISLYYLFKYSKEPQKWKYFLIFLSLTLVTCMIRELGVFLIILGIRVIFKTRRKLSIFLQISAFLGIILFSFIISGEKLINSRYVFIYFYQNIYPIDALFPYVDLSNFFTWLVIFINRLIGIQSIQSIIYASLWSFGYFLVLIFFNFFRLFKKFRDLPINFNFKHITMSFFIFYLLFSMIMLGTYISERYFLPLSICIVISFLDGNKKLFEKNNKIILLSIIGFNLIFVFIRLIMITLQK